MTTLSCKDIVKISCEWEERLSVKEVTKRAEKKRRKQCLWAYELSKGVIQCFKKCKHSFQDLLSDSTFERDALYLKRQRVCSE